MADDTKEDGLIHTHIDISVCTAMDKNSLDALHALLTVSPEHIFRALAGGLLDMNVRVSIDTKMDEKEDSAKASEDNIVAFPGSERIH